jgi:hypothetical protein
VTLETRRVPYPRGDLDTVHRKRIKALQAKAAAAQAELEQYVVDVHLGGVSLRAITAETGIAGTTILRWVAARKP